MILYLRKVAGLLLLTAGLLACSSQMAQVDTASPVEAAPAAAEPLAIHRKPASPPGLQQTLTQVYSQLLQNRDGELYSGAVAGTRRLSDAALWATGGRR